MAYFLPQKLKSDFKTKQLLQNSPLNFWRIEPSYTALQCLFCVFYRTNLPDCHLFKKKKKVNYMPKNNGNSKLCELYHHPKIPSLQVASTPSDEIIKVPTEIQLSTAGIARFHFHE